MDDCRWCLRKFRTTTLYNSIDWNLITMYERSHSFCGIYGSYAGYLRNHWAWKTWNMLVFQFGLHLVRFLGIDRGKSKQSSINSYFPQCLQVWFHLGGLAKYSVHLTATALKQLLHHFFVYIRPPPLGSKNSNGHSFLMV